MNAKPSMAGVVWQELAQFKDPRGWLAEIWRADDSSFNPAMSYVSVTLPGIARGPHEHVKQSDMFVFLGPGKFKLYLWDNRKDSATYNQRFTAEVGDGRPASVIIPPGVVHAYKCVSDVSGWVINLPDKLYRGEGKKEEIDEIRWEADSQSPFITD